MTNGPSATVGETMDLFGAHASRDLLGGLNPPQEEAVRYEGGPLLVLAGAGSGKTRVLTRRVAWLIGARRVFPASILAVTFTNKAAAEMKERITALVGDEGRHVWTGTFHSIGARLLRREADRLGISRDFSIFDRADSISAMKRVLAGMGMSPKEHAPESLLAVISRAKNDLKTPADFANEAQSAYDRLLANAYARYEEQLRVQNALDFDDLLVQPVRVLEDEEMRQRWARRFAHVLVDEYQDTNRCQYEFLRRLSQDHRQLFVVGDDDQSIYRWRGADLSNILDFENDHPDAHVVRLEQNYRSTGRILRAANSVISHNESRKGKELWTENAEGDPIVVLEVPDEQMEALSVLKIIKAAMAEEHRTADEFVVLYRTNAQSRVLENTFQLGGVAYQVIGGQRFYERREIKDVLAYLRLIVNPSDDVALTRILNVPARGIGKKSLEDLQELARGTGVSLIEAIRQAVAGEWSTLRPALRVKLGEFLDVIDGASARARTTTVAQLTEEILETVAYEEYLEREAERDSVARWENVTELLAAMQEFAEADDREDATVASFLQEVALVTDIDDWEENAPRVTLMTLHNAKGLEFPVVFITGVEEGLFPHSNSAHEPAGLEEERRLLYVGITRARERVTLLHAGSRRQYGGFNLCTPSRFLDEIDPDLVERRSLAPEPPRSGGWRSSRPFPSRPERPVARPSAADYLPRYEDESQEVGQVQPGMRVMHPSWGEGVIEGTEGHGESLKLTIRFRGGVLKKVLAAYAKLELLG